MVSLGGAPLSLPSFITPQFKEFFRLGRALRTTLPTGKGGVVHLFVVYGYQVAEDDSDQLLLTDKLLQAVLAEALDVCVGQPVLIAGDLNADPAAIPCLANGISAGKFVDLALVFSRGAGTAPVATCRFSLEGGAGTRGDFLVGCPNALAASDACFGTDRWLLPTSLLLLALWYVNLSGLPVGWILLIGPPRLLLVLSRMSGMSTGMSWGWFLMMLFLPLGMLPPGLVLMIFGLFGAGVRRMGCSVLILGLVDPLWPAALLFLVEVCSVFVAGVWEAELLVAVVLVGCIGSVMGIRLMCIVLSPFSTLLLLLLYSFVDVSSLLRMCIRVSGTKDLLLLDGMLFSVTGRL